MYIYIHIYIYAYVSNYVRNFDHGSSGVDRDPPIPARAGRECGLGQGRLAASERVGESQRLEAF